MLPRLLILFLLASAFVHGILVKENDSGQLVPPTKTTSVDKAESDEPLVNAEEIVQQRERRTIGASVQANKADSSGMSQNYGSDNGLESLEAAINGEAGSQKNLLQSIAIAFGIEMIVTFVVLSIAFQIVGFPSVLRQLLVLSLAVALTGALVDTLLRLGPLNPVRAALGFVILALLIRPLTEVREWATAIKIAVIARLVSIAMLWLAMIGLSMLVRI